MGFKLSRLAQAVIALTLCSAYAQAAEQSDDFYIEIKGPDKAVQQPAQIQPSQVELESTNHGASGTKQAKPYVPENKDRYAITASTKVYGPVRKTDTAWSISESIKRLYPGESLNTPQVLRALYRKNPRAFGGRRMDNLLAGVRLTIPSLAEIKSAQVVVAKPTTSVSPQQTVPTKVTQKPAASAPVVSESVSSAVPVTTVVPQPVMSTTTSVSASEPAKPMATVEESKPVTETQQQEHSVVASTEQGLIDPKVHELVASTETPVTPAKEPVVNPLREEIQVVQSENDELKNRIQELNTQIGALQAKAQNQDELNAQIEDLQNKIKELENQNKTEVTATPEKVEGDFWHDILSTPLNLLLLISLPVLAVLVLVSFWLRARSKRELAIKEQEMAETTALAMDDSSSAFDDLFSADITNDDVIPDLNATDDQNMPHEIDLSLPDEEEFAAALNQVETSVSEPETESVELIDELPDLNMLDEETALYTGDTVEPAMSEEMENAVSSEVKDDFSALLSDQDLANALEAEFATFANDEPDFSTESENKLMAQNEIEEDFSISDLDLSTPDDAFEEKTSTAFDIDKLQGDAGVQMADQIVSEPEGWEVTEEEIETIAPISETKVNLEPVKDDAGKDWTKQFETDESPKEFVSIDQLLEETNASDVNAEELKANLNVGLDEFPDMLPEQNGVDIDDDGGIGAKLDLARAYLEIDDKDSAKELLIEVREQGSSSQINEAEKLLSKIG